jgi:hypothetical protein
VVFMLHILYQVFDACRRAVIGHGL